jgi:mRNA interferase MazF
MADPRRGEVWLIDLGLAAKVRPCLVLSVGIQSVDRALITVVPHTTSPRGSRFEVVGASRFLRSGVFDAQNLITIPRPKFLRKIGNLSEAELNLVEDAVRLWLGL